MASDDPMRSLSHLRPKLFDAHADDPSLWVHHLREHGYVVLRSFLAPERRRQLLRQFWKDFATACRKNARQGRGGGGAGSAFAGVIPRDRSTWPTADELGRNARHAPLHIAQSDFFWALRQEPVMAKTFGAVFHVAPEELCVSLDSYSLNLTGHPNKGLPLHDDQAAGVDGRSDMYSVQGAYNFFEVTPEDTGLVVVPGSQYRWKSRKAGARGARHKSHFVLLSGADADYTDMHNSAVKLLLPANCFVLWSSKTLHGTQPGTRERPPRVTAAAVPTTATAVEGGGGAGGGGTAAAAAAAAAAGDGAAAPASGATAVAAGAGSKDDGGCAAAVAAAPPTSESEAATRLPAAAAAAATTTAATTTTTTTTTTAAAATTTSAASAASGATGGGAPAAVATTTTPLLNRLTCFVAMLPKSTRPPQALAGKVAIYKSGGSSSHWACMAEVHPVNVAGPIRGAVLANGAVPPERLALL